MSARYLPHTGTCDGRENKTRALRQTVITIQTVDCGARQRQLMGDRAGTAFGAGDMAIDDGWVAE